MPLECACFPTPSPLSLPQPTAGTAYRVRRAILRTVRRTRSIGPSGGLDFTSTKALGVCPWMMELLNKSFIMICQQLFLFYCTRKTSVQNHDLLFPLF